MSPLKDKTAVDSALQRGRRLGFALTLPPGVRPTAPLVLLLGWWGATDQDLRKFSELLASCGYPSVRAVTPRWQVVFPVDSPRRAFAGALLEFLEAVGWPDGDRPLVAYALGNGGSLPTEKLDYLVRNDPAHAHLRDRFAGVIFDSSPAYITRQRVNTSAATQPLPLRLLAALFAWLGGLPSRLVLGKTAGEMFWENMEQLDLGRRTLYMYSKDDQLCDADKLAQLVEARRRRGCDVEERWWPHGRHVHLFDDHRQEYAEELQSFLRSLEQSAAEPASLGTS